MTFKPNQIKQWKSPLLGLILLFSSTLPALAQDGAGLFAVNCAVCHTIGKGKLIGPDLANVQQRRDTEWIIKFIRSSTSVISSGDEVAVALFEEFNNMMMPDQPAFSDEDLVAILTYIEAESPEYDPSTDETSEAVTTEPLVAEVVGKPIEEATEEDILNGQLLFSGETRLGEKGPACLTCHNVLNDNLIGGGLLAKDLTEAFTRLNENGIKAMLTNPPFPAMREAYQNHPISDDEAYLITAFLKYADAQQYYQHHRDYSARFLYTGLAGFVILLSVFALIWRNRKSSAVNKRVFERQLKSESLNY